MRAPGKSPVLVGELNPYGSDPEMALYPLPRNASGNRLRLILDLTDLEYLDYRRVNLCTGKWGIRAARAAAAEVLEHEDVCFAVLLGAKVCSAFGVPYEPFTVRPSGRGYPLVVLPHPSGLNRAWNEPGAVEQARLAINKAWEDAS